MKYLKFYIFSESKNQYFYLKQKVQDIRTMETGIINRIINDISSEYIIEVQYKNKRIGYTLKEQQYLNNV
jgi:hypothetical protein